MSSNLLIYTSFVSPLTMKMFKQNEILPTFVLRNIRNSELIGGFSDSVIHLRDLSPSNELYQAKRDHKITIKEFKEKYREEIKHITLESIIKRLENLRNICNANAVVLLGYGSNSEICHRSVLRELLNSSGLLINKIKEIEW